MDSPDQKLIEEGHPPILLESSEQRLQKEVDDLKKQLEDSKKKDEKHEDAKPEHPKPRTLWLIALALLAVMLLAFLVGWLPHHRQEEQLKKESEAEQHALPKVSFIWAEKSSPVHTLMLPGNVEALTDAPILARADGYVRKRYADIGDHVKKGELMAELEAPDLDQQVRQGRAQLSQADAQVKQSTAALEQGKANEELARVTAVRWDNLVKKGAVSRQDNDTYQANYKAQIANSASLTQAVAAAKENAGSAQANLNRLLELQSYEEIRAPFDGVVTERNVDVGALIGTGSTLLFRVAQVDRLRTYIYVPQNNVGGVQVGQPADLFSPEISSSTFTGIVTRTSGALDPSTRTLLTEVQVPNPQHRLMPGMFVQVNLKTDRGNAPILIPGTAILVRSNGTFVGVLTNFHKVDPEQLKKEEEEARKLNKDEDKKKTKKSTGSPTSDKTATK
jgi:RND family efflux transporter MFP subunit